MSPKSPQATQIIDLEVQNTIKALNKKEIKKKNPKSFFDILQIQKSKNK